MNSFKSILEKKKSSQQIYISIIIILVFFIIACIGALWGFNQLKISRGVELLDCMYNFRDFSEVMPDGDDSPKLKTLVSEEVYKQITSSDTTLRRYTKTMGSSCKVIYHEVTSNYIIFSLDSDCITSSRKFMIIYNLNVLGKIDNLKEVEIVDFY